MPARGQPPAKQPILETVVAQIASDLGGVFWDPGGQSLGKKRHRALRVAVEQGDADAPEGRSGVTAPGWRGRHALPGDTIPLGVVGCVLRCFLQESHVAQCTGEDEQHGQGVGSPEIQTQAVSAHGLQYAQSLLHRMAWPSPPADWASLAGSRALCTHQPHICLLRAAVYRTCGITHTVRIKTQKPFPCVLKVTSASGFFLFFYF